MHCVQGSLKHHQNLVVVEGGPQMKEAFQVEVVEEGIQVKEEGEEGVEEVAVAHQLMNMVEEDQPVGPVQHGE